MTVDCAVCGSGPAHAKLTKGEIDILECPSCGLAFWVPDTHFRPESVYDAAYFQDVGAPRGYDDYAAQERALRASASRRLVRLGRPRPGARLLDVGAAYGFAVDEARRVGWRAVGVEVSVAAAAAAGRHALGRVALTRGFELPFASGVFDAVTLWDVIEHLPSPHASIAEVARVLGAGGRLVLTTGDVGSIVARICGSRWHLYTLPEHLYFHTRESLRRLLEAHGFRIVRLRSDAAVFTLGYLVERLRKTLLGRAAVRAAHWPGAGLCVPVNLFDVVTVEAVLGANGAG